MSVIEHIYEALLDDEALNALPGHLAELVGARSATLQTVICGVPVHVATHYFSEAMSAFYLANDIISVDPWIPIVTGQGLTNRVVDADDHISRADFARCEFYNEFFRRFGDDTGVSLGAIISVQNGFVGLGLHRALNAPCYNAQERAALDTALPHLRRLAETRSKLAQSNAALRDVGALLHAQSLAILLADRGGRIHFANLAAEAMLASADGVWCQRGVLRFCGETVGRLSRAIVEASAGKGGDAVLVARPSGKPSYRVVVAPHRGPGAAAGRAMLMIEDPLLHDRNLADRLRRLFGLTQAEADLAERLYGGRSLADIAEARAVQYSTVRTQLNSVLAKTETTRQSELLTMIARLPKPMT